MMLFFCFELFRFWSVLLTLESLFFINYFPFMKSLLFLFSLVSFLGNAQPNINLEESLLQNLEKHFVDIVDSTFIYVNDGQSTDLFYYAISPKDSIIGTLVLFPPNGQTMENVINHNLKLIEIAHSKKLLIIIPSINYNLCLDAISMSFLNSMFNQVLGKYSPPTDKFVFGGFSLGGMNAIRYAEMAHDSKSETAIKPIAVYGVDPPLDMARLYNSFQRTMEKNFSEVAMYEAKVFIRKMEDQFGGSPKEFPDVYLKYSMYSKNQKDGGNAKYLLSIPVRIYCDPDIDWQLKERRMDYYDMNAVDQTAMINQLVLMGNKNAEFINSLGKGYRLDGRRHPHSWSLVDPKECVEWIEKCIALSK